MKTDFDSIFKDLKSRIEKDPALEQVVLKDLEDLDCMLDATINGDSQRLKLPYVSAEPVHTKEWAA